MISIKTLCKIYLFENVNSCLYEYEIEPLKLVVQNIQFPRDMNNSRKTIYYKK